MGRLWWSVAVQAVVLLLVAATNVTALPGADEPEPCVVSSIYQLPQCVRFDARILIAAGEDSQEIEGRFRGFTRDHLVIETGGAELFRFFHVNGITGISVRTHGSRGKSALVGATTGAIAGGLIGLPTASWPAIAGAAAGGALFNGTRKALFPPLNRKQQIVIASGTGEPPAEASTSASLAANVSELKTMLKTGEQLSVRRSGTLLTGRYAGIDGEELLVGVGDQVLRFQNDEIASVSHRTWHHPSWKKGALIGALAGAILMGASMAQEKAHPEDNPDPTTVGVAIGGVAFIAGIGAATTRLMGREDTLVMAGGSFEFHPH